MSDKDLKKALGYFLGLETKAPEENLEYAVNQMSRMKERPKMQPELKNRGWENIRVKMNDSKPDNETIRFLLLPVLKYGLAAIFLIIVSVFSFNYFGLGKLNGEIVAASGAIFVDGVKKEVPFTVSEGQVIESEGSYRLLFQNHMALNAEYSSKITFYRKGKRVSLNLMKGAVAAVIQKNKTNDITFLTPTGDVHVKGTVFYLRVMDENNTYFCICHGKVDLVLGPQVREVSALHHAGFSMKRDPQGEKIVNDTMKYHHDPLLEEMAREIHYPLSWSLK